MAACFAAEAEILFQNLAKVRLFIELKLRNDIVEVNLLVGNRVFGMEQEGLCGTDDIKPQCFFAKSKACGKLHCKNALPNSACARNYPSLPFA